MINTQDVSGNPFPVKKTSGRLYKLLDVHHLSYDQHMFHYQVLLENIGCTLLTRNPSVMFNACYSSIGFFLLGYMAFSDIYFISANMDDISKVTECLPTMVTGVLCILKWMYLLVFRTRIVALVDDLREFCDEAQASGKQEWDLMVKQLSEARVTARLYYWAVNGAIACFILCAVLKYDERALPFLSPMAGIPRHHPVGYFVNFVLHFWVMILFRNILCSFLALMVYFWLIMAARIDILNYRLKCIERRVDSMEDEPVIKNDEGLAQYEVRSAKHRTDHACVHKYLRDCYQFHQKVFSIADRMNAVFKYDCLAEIIMSTFVGCAALFQVTAEDSSNKYKIIFYFSCCVVQIFYYCWYCHLVMHKSLEVCDAVGQVGWYRLAAEDQRTLGIMLLRAQRPVLLTAVFFNLNLDMFTAIMKTTYSYYAVLRNVDEEE